MSAVAPAARDALTINVLRGLAIDAVEHAKSGHPGMPLGAAPMAYALWSRHLRFDPSAPDWVDRDRFILSAGHGSMLLYGLLHLFGYDLELEDLRQFRQLGSRTPGHPENHLTPGVEMATGPLGQGIATAVGMALAESWMATTFNRSGHAVVNHHTYVLCSDGDLMEGISHEACALAGHWGLGKLIALYDSNHITIDGGTELAFTEDTPQRFEAIGWHVLVLADGMDVDAVDAAIKEAKRVHDKPSLIVCPTVIGYGAPTKAGSEKSHGAPLGAEEARETKAALGLPEEAFWVPDEVRETCAIIAENGAQSHLRWQDLFTEYQDAHPDLAEAFANALAGEWSEEWLENLPKFETPIATRSAFGAVLQVISREVPTLLGGSADLTHSVMTEQKGLPYYSRTQTGGRNINFGVREHGMGAILNGLNLHGGVRAFGGTFLIFSDYCRPAIRLAALMQVPTIFVFSHDSIGLGEDGPTHQPVEQLMSLRAIPNLNVMRPADAHELVVCWKIALASTDTPCVFVTSRQNLPVLSPAPVGGAHPAERGGYVLLEDEEAVLTLVATGSEVALAMEAVPALVEAGMRARVVSLPSWSIFAEEEAQYIEDTMRWDLPCISIEAGATLGWNTFAEATIGMTTFGVSAPGPAAMREFGFTVENIVATAKDLMNED